MPAKKQEKQLDIKVDYTAKQKEALEILYDQETKYFVYGGSKGGGKSVLGSIYALLNCVFYYPGCRGLIGREKLIDLKQSTLETFFLQCNKWGLIENKHYTYNQQLNKISFWNSSEIILTDLAYSPSDSFYSGLNGIEVSWIWVDESQEIIERCKNILSTLIRYKLSNFNLLPGMLLFGFYSIRIISVFENLVQLGLLPKSLFEKLKDIIKKET